MVEEPLRARDFEACRLIRKTLTRLCLDESVLEPADALVAIRAEACDVINVKLMKTGGILGAIKLNAIAEAAGVATHVGNMGHSTIGVAAILHLHAALSNATSSDIDPPDRGGDLAQDIASGPMRRTSDGVSEWAPPLGPGLGVTLDEGAIESATQRSGTERPMTAGSHAGQRCDGQGATSVRSQQPRATQVDPLCPMASVARRGRSRRRGAAALPH